MPEVINITLSKRCDAHASLYNDVINVIEIFCAVLAYMWWKLATVQGITERQENMPLLPASTMKFLSERMLGGGLTTKATIKRMESPGLQRD